MVYETGTAMTSTGALTAYSGSKTGRSPLDKRVVKEESSEKDIWWGPVNKPMTPDVSAHVTKTYHARGVWHDAEIVAVALPPRIFVVRA